jgi:3-dehydroquinate synthase
MSPVPETISVRSRFRDYTVELRDDDAWCGELAARPHAFIVVDENAWKLHRDGCLAAFAANDVHVLPASEEGKTLATVEKLYDAMTVRVAKRNSVVVSVGGGVVQDVTGFLASTIYRGVDWAFVPSTLLAQADSCIGAKTSLNHRRFKNLLGTMYPPERVIVHTPFVLTQNEEHYFSGLGEVVKLHLIAGADAAQRMAGQIDALAARDVATLNEAVRASLLIKREYIESDEFDRGRRVILNFGHCFGHAIESATDFAVPHGQAVVLGMLLAGLVSRERGLLTEAALDETARALLLPVLICRPTLDDGAMRAVVEAMKQDKKRTGTGLALVLPDGDWSPRRVDDLSEEEATRALMHLPEMLVRGGGLR